MSAAARAAEDAARASYGRLLASLARWSRDIVAAEDALADAFARALSDWPQRGVPQNPEGWLLRAAKNVMVDEFRRSARVLQLADTDDVAPQREGCAPDTQIPAGFPDDRLALMMVCAHPAIARDLHTPLMLQTVLGLDAGEIARIFALPRATLAQRLVRAKRKIKTARIPFEMPCIAQLDARAEAVMEAIYGLHAADWFDPVDDMGHEALFLADLLVRLLPASAEAKGLAALIAYTQARREARVCETVLVPIDEQDIALWDDRLSSYARQMLLEAGRHKTAGRFQLEAAIQAVHMDRASIGFVKWDEITLLYLGLLRLCPSVGAQVGHAVALSRSKGTADGLEVLQAMPAHAICGFQPYWAALSDLLYRDGQTAPALSAARKAHSLSTELPLRRWLEKRIEDLKSTP